MTVQDIKLNKFLSENVGMGQLIILNDCNVRVTLN